MTKEWEIGEHKAEFDEEYRALVVTTAGLFKAENVAEFMKVLSEAYEGLDSGRNMLFDVTYSSSKMMDKEARDALMEEFSKFGNDGTDKVAVVGATPSVRMLSKVMMKVIGGAESTRFFKTREDALKWFKEG